MNDPQATFPPAPRAQLLAVVLMAGFALRTMNALRRAIPGGLNGVHVLLDILLADRVRRLGLARPVPGGRVRQGPDAGGSSILAVSAATGVPRESARRTIMALTHDGWLAALPQGGRVPGERTRRDFALRDDARMLVEFAWVSGEVRATQRAQDADVERLVARYPWHAALATERESLSHPGFLAARAALAERVRLASPGMQEACAHVADGYLYRHLGRLRRTFDGDLMLPVLIGEIAHRNISALAHRDDASDEARQYGTVYGGTPRSPDVRWAPINAHSLSQAMALPDATVRRKIAYLAQRGWIEVSEHGLLSVTPEVRRHATPMNGESLADMIACHQALADLGLVP
ncbi:MAG: hypothetical protein U1F10_16680 [Burkholderiales bacterium]